LNLVNLQKTSVSIVSYRLRDKLRHAPNNKRRISNAEYRTPNIERQTQNSKRRTLNKENRKTINYQLSTINPSTGSGQRHQLSTINEQRIIKHYSIQPEHSVNETEIIISLLYPTIELIIFL
jgi:hypothetical protein